MKIKFTQKMYPLFIMAVYFSFVQIASATAQSIDQLVRQAEFVFEGKVIDVGYRFSQGATGESTSVPYTFVSYQVFRVLKGNYSGSSIVLRFIGGPGQDGVVFSMAGTPRFDVGDHDILLVDQNGYEICPLVNCAQGRFRYINGLVVNEYGQVIEIHNGQLQLGQMVDLDEVTTHKMGDMTLTRREMKKVDGEEVPVGVTREKANTGLMPDTAGFTSYIQEKIYANHDMAELAALPAYSSVDPEQPFRDELLERIYTPSEEPESMRAPEPERAKKPAQASRQLPAETPSVVQQKIIQHPVDVQQASDKVGVMPVKSASYSWHIFALVLGAILLFFILVRRVR